MKTLNRKRTLHWLGYATGLIIFGVVAYWGCATAPKISPEEEAAMRAREQARQDSIRRFEVAKKLESGPRKLQEQRV